MTLLSRQLRNCKIAALLQTRLPAAVNVETKNALLILLGLVCLIVKLDCKAQLEA